MLKLFNTLSRTKANFSPRHGKTVKIYTCGPTVYDYAHLGNMRSYIFADILTRSLAYLGYEPKQVMNITDVGHLTADSDTGDDKVERAAAEKKMDAWVLAKFYTQAFLVDLKKLNIHPPDKMPRATDHIKEQIALVKVLERKGYTYNTSDGVYFDTSKFKHYGQLARLEKAKLKAGARVALGEKKHPTDFALWKFTPRGTERQMEWPSPWGHGFPGWHIECSAMSTKYLGQPFDIHTGGIDHIPIHHTNEIAQSEAAMDKPLARFWLHGEFLVLKKGGQKTRMGKSEGNIMTLAELERRGIPSLAYRYLCLNTHHRKQMEFSWEALEGAHDALVRLWQHAALASGAATLARRGPQRGKPARSRPARPVQKYINTFHKAIEDDLNMPQALAVVWEVVRSMLTPKEKYALLIDFDRVLGLSLAKPPVGKVIIPKQIKNLVTERESARRKQDWRLADSLRQQIQKAGFTIEDAPTGPKLKNN